MSVPRILVIGSANIDLVTRVARVPRPGESVVGLSFATVTGGKGANQAIAAARMGGRTTFVGCVGKDVFGDQQRASLEEAGVDARHLLVDPEAPTGTAVILVAEEGQNSIVVTPAANYGLRPELIDQLDGLFRDTDVLLLQLEIPLATVSAALAMARKHGVVSILDAGPAQPIADEMLQAADVISPNETEAETITGVTIGSVDDGRRAAAVLLERGARAVVLKLGGMGSLYAGPEGMVHVPAFEVKAVDTTAAGDAFTAALGLRWGHEGVAAALRFANAAGGLAATVAGAQPSMPTEAAVEGFLRRNT